ARAAGAERRGASSGPGRGAVDGDGYGSEARRAALPRPRRHSESVRHAYYPGRRMNLGVVLLPLRIFLGFISVYGGMGKLSDPVYFDGGERGSMVTWLRTLHPWPIAEPLRDLALEHPVGAGLTVAFLQIVVGVLTVLGLWQRLAASVGALLSAALILTVSWRTVPVYDAPDIIYLAAWSPLIIAGAPVYSADARLAGEAWRRLGPRSELWQLRRRVLRRGSVMAMVVAGLTLLTGSMLGAAVRSSEVVKGPEPSDLPTNNLPGSPLPSTSVESPRGGSRGPLGAGGSAGARSPRERLPHRPEPSASASGSASGGPSAPEASSGTSGTSGRPSGTSRTRPGLGTTPRSPRHPVAPTATAGPPRRAAPAEACPREDRRAARRRTTRTAPPTRPGRRPPWAASSASSAAPYRGNFRQSRLPTAVTPHSGNAVTPCRAALMPPRRAVSRATGAVPPPRRAVRSHAAVPCRAQRVSYRRHAAPCRA
ncbi:DoxX family protein, partial [Streptomyces hygroscopicus]|uniref:DoxX family protein n=1 Tax=Streptomyces hygroscopicus TaxID=1912 RepID=UPI000AE4A804